MTAPGGRRKRRHPGALVNRHGRGLAAKNIPRARGVFQHPYAAVVVIPAGTVARVRPNALIDVEMLTFDGPADVEGDHQAQFVLAVKLAVIIQQRHLGQQGGSAE